MVGGTRYKEWFVCQIIMMSSEKHTKYDVDLEKGTTEWVGEKITNGLETIDKRKKNIYRYICVI